MVQPERRAIEKRARSSRCADVPRRAGAALRGTLQRTAMGGIEGAESLFATPATLAASASDGDATRRALL